MVQITVHEWSNGPGAIPGRTHGSGLVRKPAGELVQQMRATMRAAPVGSWAIAVCVCVNCLIYRYITVHRCTLIPVHTNARLGGALPWEH